MTNYGQQPPNPYQQNPYGQQPNPYQQGQPPQGPYGQPVQYGQRPQYGQPAQQPPNPYGQPPQNPYGQPPPPNPYGEREYRQPPPPPQPGQQGPQGQWVAQTPSRPTVVPRSIPVATLDALPGREIAEIIGDVVGVVARGRDLPPELRGGGMEAGYVSMLTRSRQDAVARAVEMAESAGADAVLGLRFDCSEITQNLSEVVAYGTAVKLVPLAGEAEAAAPTEDQETPVSAVSASEPTVSTPRSEPPSSAWGPPQSAQRSEQQSGPRDQAQSPPTAWPAPSDQNR